MSPKDNAIGEALAVLSTDVKYIKDDLQTIRRSLESTYVTKNEFDPIKKVVYGLVGIILTTVIGAWVSMTSLWHK